MVLRLLGRAANAAAALGGVAAGGVAVSAALARGDAPAAVTAAVSLVEGLLLVRASLMPPVVPPEGVRHVLVPLVSTYWASFGWLLVRAHPVPLAWPARVGLVLVALWVAWAALTLGESFSVVVEARRLVRSGPYSLVRHPVYLGYAASFAVTWLGAWPRLAADVPMLAVWAPACLLFWWRARMEDDVLARLEGGRTPCGGSSASAGRRS